MKQQQQQHTNKTKRNNKQATEGFYSKSDKIQCTTHTNKTLSEFWIYPEVKALQLKQEFIVILNGTELLY